MKEENCSGISFFQKYLTVWVLICMLIGIIIGRFLPEAAEFLNRFEYAGVSVPMAVLIWLMIYPMMIKIDFQSIKNVSKNPKGLFVTWIVNWLIKPFTMYAIACLFFLLFLKSSFQRNWPQNIWQVPYCSEPHRALLWYLYGAL